VQEGDRLVGRHHQQAVGLGPAGRQLGDELARGHAHRAGDPLLVGDPVPQQPPIQAGGPSRRTAPATSRKASSRLTGSTSGVTDRKISITPWETSAYRSGSGSITTACGHSRRARASGIAECTPDRRAS